MAIIMRLKDGSMRSTKRKLPSLFDGKNRNIRRYRVIGDNHVAQCENTICDAKIGCGEDCALEVACDVDNNNN